MKVADNIIQNQKEHSPLIGKVQKEQIQWLLICLFMLGYVLAVIAQNPSTELNYSVTSGFVPTMKDVIKFNDLPEIKDSVKKIENIKYGINSQPVLTKYQTQTIEAAKLQNEPLQKLYHSVLKLGYGPVYNMPYGEFWLSNGRSKEKAYGAHLRHFSSTAHLRDVGYSGFSDNSAMIYGKKFYKKHTLNADLNYSSNMLHYYGYDTTINHLEDDYTKQRYQLVEPRIQLQSHYTDSTHINHNIGLSYYNYQNLYKESENNFKASAAGNMFVNSEKLNFVFLSDYYNNKQQTDTFNDLILTLNPSFEANGKKWKADIGVTGTLDNFKNVSRFYFYPQLNLQYDIYESLVIPYAGVNGGLIKNSFKSLSRENPYIDTTFNYQNTNNQYKFFGGLKGNLSSNTSYDASVTYAQYDNMHFFVMDYGGPNMIYNRFDVIYDKATLLTLNGQLKYQIREKFNVTGKGNYYIWNTKTITRAYHKPDFDLTLSGIYNLQSKFILRADLFFMGQQWAYSPGSDGLLKPNIIKGWADLNIEGEYRYSKMLSFFARFNNLANATYYRWDRYPSQRFNFMVGLTFVPF